MNVSGAEAEHKIAAVENVANVAMDPLKARLITDGAMPMRCDCVGDSFAADFWERRFARRINVGHDDTIGVIERAAEFFGQRLGARIAMRLKHGEYAFASHRARGLKGRFDFSGMMPVIVHQKETRAVVFNLESSPRVLEFPERSGDFIERHAELARQRDHTDGVVNVVLARHVQHPVSEFFAAAVNRKRRTEVAQLNVAGSVIGRRAQTKGNSAPARST